MDLRSKVWFPYGALTAGLLLALLGSANWVLVLCGWGACVVGCAELAPRSGFFGKAIVPGGALMVLTLVRQLHVLPQRADALLQSIAIVIFCVLLCLGFVGLYRRR